MSEIVDYSSARPDPHDLAAAGYIGAARYLAWLPNRKVITGDELAALHDAGLAVAFVWEVGTDWTTWDGAEADQQLAALGVDDTVPVYWAVDRDYSDYELVGRMLDGVNSRRRRGIYGGSGLVQYQLDHGHAAFGWISSATAWGHGQPAPGAHLRQLIGGAPFGCDRDDVLQDDWGQWSPQGANDMGTIDKAQYDEIIGWLGNIGHIAQEADNALNDPNIGVLRRLNDLAAQMAPDKLAEAVAKKLPAGSVSQAVLEQALRDVLKQGVG